MAVFQWESKRLTAVLVFGKTKRDVEFGGDQDNGELIVLSGADLTPIFEDDELPFGFTPTVRVVE